MRRPGADTAPRHIGLHRMSNASRAFKPSGIRRTGLAVAAVLVVGVGSAPASAEAVPAEQELVVLMRGHIARTAPDPGAQKIATIRGRRPLSKVRTAIPVIAHAAAADGTPWLQVILPGRPKQKLGWIAAANALNTGCPAASRHGTGRMRCPVAWNVMAPVSLSVTENFVTWQPAQSFGFFSVACDP